MLSNINQVNTFKELAEELVHVGINKEAAELFVEYVNPDNHYDLSVFKKMVHQSNTRYYSGAETKIKKLSKAIAKMDPAAQMHYIVASHKLLGRVNDRLTRGLGSHFSDEEIYSYYVEIFGDAKEAAMQYMIADFSIAIIEDAVPEGVTLDTSYCLNAAKEAIDVNPLCAINFCTKALCLYPDLKNAKDDAIINEIVELIISLSIKLSNGKYRSAMRLDYEIKNSLVALGNAAFVSVKARELFFSWVKEIKLDNLVFDMRDINYYRALIEYCSNTINNKTFIHYYIFDSRNRYNDARIIEGFIKAFPDACYGAYKNESVVEAKAYLREAIKKTNPSLIPEDDDPQKDLENQMLADSFKDTFYYLAVKKFIDGLITKEELEKAAANQKKGSTYSYNIFRTYINQYGANNFAVRYTIARLVYVCICQDKIYSININLDEYVAGLVHDERMTAGDIVEYIDLYVRGSYYYNPTNVAKIIADSFDRLDYKDIDTSNLQAGTRELLLDAFGYRPDYYKDNILSMASDSSVAVQEVMVKILSKTNWKEDIIGLLSAKKMGARACAISVIEKAGTEGYEDAISKALDAEKSEKLKTRLLKLSAIATGEEIVTEEVIEDLSTKVRKLVGGNKVKKLDWLYESPLPSVNKKDGSDGADEYVKAIMLSYADDPGMRSSLADILADELVTEELAKFADAAYGAWVAAGAIAKNKWVLSFAAIHGSQSIIDDYVYAIKDWADNMRGAIAADAVRALALNGSSKALMIVDNMSRKFKNKQVKNAAIDALNKAAYALGITKEELSDKIVPDLGFDDKMCRTFDFGPRQFQVYLTPALEIEIFCGDKKVKSLPKPGASDDAELSAKATADFKEMKKQMKNVITSQKDRLEYVLLCDRKWTAENWTKLFVKNPIMHCFAVGLIWGVYKDDKLETCFRYLDDGSFTTSDEDEYEIPEGAQIGLVHPIELSSEEKAAWVEQLSDYEIKQPFPQMSREIYEATEEELQQDKITRFDGMTMGNLALLGRMLKAGWEKGMAEDAGCFYEFLHRDYTGVKVLENNAREYMGMVAQFNFSGMYIASFSYGDEEDMELGSLEFYDANHTKKPLKISEVSKRYFSEIIYQLRNVTAGAEE